MWVEPLLWLFPFYVMSNIAHPWAKRNKFLCSRQDMKISFFGTFSK